MMDLNLVHTGTGCAKCVLNVTLNQELTQELIIPDTMPDVLNVIDTDAVPLLKSKDAEGGRAMAGGVLSCTVLYQPDGADEVKNVTCELPFEVSSQGDEVNTQTRVIACASVSQMNTSISNSRKLMIKAEISVTLKCYNDTGVQMCSNIEAPEQAELLLLPNEESFMTAMSVREKTFVISNELTVNGANPPIGELIKTKSELIADDVKAVGNKIIVRGRAQTEIVYRAAGASQLICEAFSEEFSQIVEMDTMSEGGAFEVFPMLTGAYYDTDMMTEKGEGSTVVSELHAVLQCVAYTRVQLTYISDAYSTKYTLSDARETVTMLASEKSFDIGGLYRDTVEISPKPSKILFSSLFSGQISKTVQGGAVTFSSRQYIRIVYADESGKINSYLHRLDVSSSCDREEGIEYEAVQLHSRDLSVSAAAGVAEIRLHCEFEVTSYSKKEMTMISELSVPDEEKRDLSGLPSVLVHTTAADETMWLLAKMYNTTPAMILGINELEPGDGIAGKKLLIIPKKR